MEFISSVMTKSLWQGWTVSLSGWLYSLSKCYLTISTLSSSPESITFEHKLTYLWKFIISFVKLRLNYKSILSEKCFETQCLLMMPYLLHFYVCVSCYGYFLLFLIALLELQEQVGLYSLHTMWLWIIQVYWNEEQRL